MASPGRSYYSLLFVSDTLAQKGGLDSECLEGIGGLTPRLQLGGHRSACLEKVKNAHGAALAAHADEDEVDVGARQPAGSGGLGMGARQERRASASVSRPKGARTSMTRQAAAATAAAAGEGARDAGCVQ